MKYGVECGGLNGLDTYVWALNVDLHRLAAPCKMSFLVTGQIINPWVGTQMIMFLSLKCMNTIDRKTAAGKFQSLWEYLYYHYICYSPLEWSEESINSELILSNSENCGLGRRIKYAWKELSKDSHRKIYFYNPPNLDIFFSCEYCAILG